MSLVFCCGGRLDTAELEGPLLRSSRGGDSVMFDEVGGEPNLAAFGAENEPAVGTGTARGVAGAEAVGDVIADGRGGRRAASADAAAAGTRSVSCSTASPNGEGGRLAGSGRFCTWYDASCLLVSPCSRCHDPCQSGNGGSAAAAASAPRASAMACAKFCGASVMARRKGACGRGASTCGSIDRRAPRFVGRPGDAAKLDCLPHRRMGLLASERMLGDDRDGVPCTGKIALASVFAASAARWASSQLQNSQHFNSYVVHPQQEKQ